MTRATCQYLLGLAIAARDRAAAAMIAADEETSVEYGQAALAVRELLGMQSKQKQERGSR